MTPFILTLHLLYLPGGLPESDTYVSYCIGKSYSVTVTKKMLQASPSWEDDTDNPPLSARKALKLAPEKKERLVKDTKDWKWRLESASLTVAGEKKWYWLVNYTADYQSPSGTSGSTPSLRLIVLMDGTVVEPKE